jgi:uncharacterized repeat protein (TIGR03803 family)
MSCNKRLGRMGAALLVIGIATLLMMPARAASKYKVLYKFTGGNDGEFPPAGLILDQAGNLYGTTAWGGGAGNGAGTVFKLIPNSDGSWTKSMLYKFCSLMPSCGDGENPYATVTFDQAGNLYGTTESGGNPGCFDGLGCGVVFKLTPNADGSWQESVPYRFCSLTNCRDGSMPDAGLIFDGAGNLYGVTDFGGNSGCQDGQGCGVVFKLTPNADGSWKEQVLHAFTGGKDGASPIAKLVFDAEGNLYGTTYFGWNSSCNGGLGCGVVFKLTPNADGSWKEKVLHQFTGGADGSSPRSVLIFDQAGHLYGTTQSGGEFNACNRSGCGLVFQLTANADGSWKEKVLHQFTGGADGGQPFAGLIFDRAGNLYGMTTRGGNFNCGGGCGVVFKLVPNSKGEWKERVLHYFVDHPGANPFDSDLIFDAEGNLYGTTNGDGNKTLGSVFEITP